MELGYSFGDIEPVWIPGNLPFPERTTGQVNVALKGSATGRFPPCAAVGTLIAYHRRVTNSAALVLQLHFRHGSALPFAAPPPIGQLYPPAGTPIYAFLRIALPPAAIDQITKVTADGHEYELTLDDVTLIDKTACQQSSQS
jgi:hypothetical protein